MEIFQINNPVILQVLYHLWTSPLRTWTILVVSASDPIILALILATIEITIMDLLDTQIEAILRIRDAFNLRCDFMRMKQVSLYMPWGRVERFFTLLSKKLGFTFTFNQLS